MTMPALTSVEFDDLGPQRIYHYYEPSVQLRAVVVIDTTRFGLTAGGVRMAADLSLTEMVRLSRAMSYKFAMLELPCGGAKAGIWLDPASPTRGRVMRAFLDAIQPLVESRAYLPGPDMGTSAADFADLHAGAGNAQQLAMHEVDGMPLEDQLTGYGVVVAARAAAEWLGGGLAAATVAIEGFGKVGGGAAKFFAREGARVVAISTIRGTLDDPGGIDIDRLLALRSVHGDGAVQEYDTTRSLLPREALPAVPADVLAPGARPDAIHEGNVEMVRARLIVPAANIPYAEGIPERLAARQIVALPDFVTNAGGVLAGLAGMQGLTADDAFRLVRERIPPNVHLVLQAARDRGGSAHAAGVAIARARVLAA